MNNQPLNYRFSTLAEEDLLDIFLGSIKTWGIEKARQYARNIEDTCQQLADYPDMGKSRNDIFPGAFSFPVGSHLIFYRPLGNMIEIARVLHQRMDYEKHLNLKPADSLPAQ